METIPSSKALSYQLLLGVELDMPILEGLPPPNQSGRPGYASFPYPFKIGLCQTIPGSYLSVRGNGKNSRQILPMMK